MVKKEKPVPRPESPRVDEPAEVSRDSERAQPIVESRCSLVIYVSVSSQGEEERELAVIHLQKLLRGRSIQYKV